MTRRILGGFIIAIATAMTLWLAPTSLRAGSGLETPPSAENTRIDRGKLLLGPRDSRGTPSLTSDPAGWIMGKQQQFYRSMSMAIRGIGREPVAASLTLIGLSFGYGVFHAAGPGHGKAVVSAWLMGNDERLRRGIAIAFMAAIVQACTAVTLVTVLLWAVGAASSLTRDVARWLEALSFLLISGLGFWLIWQALSGSVTRLTSMSLAAVPGSLASPRKAHHARGRHDDDHHHHHDGSSCSCGHAHVPSAAAVAGPWSIRRALSIAFAVGIRPCTGALLVLLFSSAAGLYWAGVMSTFAMALGTAITVSVIAALAVGSRHAALAVVGGNSALLDWTGFTLRLGSGLVVASLGLLLFWAALHGGVTAG